MVLSNKERQARYRQRLKEAADRGVTPEMVIKATRLSYEYDPMDGQPSWDEFVKGCKGKRRRDDWQQFVPDDLDDDYSEFGDDAELMRKVAAVARAVKFPPAP